MHFISLFVLDVSIYCKILLEWVIIISILVLNTFS